ncbi:MAG: O-methyltransferase-domain-containing protein [Monoraphidium minutum]|nr:MAG: O-methyltransferase-domain-containing protein [Monoraphidium minutum]
MGPAALALYALAATGAAAWAAAAFLLIAWLQLRPWSDANRDHSAKVAALPYAAFAAGCWSRHAGGWVAAQVPAPMLAVEAASAFLKSQVLFTLVELGVPEALQAGPRTATALAAACGAARPEWLARVLAAADECGFWRDGEFEYSSNAITACLARGHRSSVADMVRLYQYNYESAAALPESIRRGVPSHELRSGGGFWAQLAGDPKKGAVFDAAMASFKDLGGASVVAGYDWSQYSTVLDVAGGNGSFLAALLGRCPHLRGVVIDQKQQVERAPEWWRGAHPDLLPRAAFVAGDMFDGASIPPPPAGGGRAAYVLRNILHNWPDADALRILKGIRAAIPAGAEARAALCIIELTSSPAGLPALLEPRLLADVQMLALFGGGKERDEGQFRRLLAAAGFALARAVRTAGPLLVLEAAPV